MTKIRAIHPFGPPVGKWTVHATVPATIARQRKRLKEEAERQQAAEVEAKQKTVSIKRITK